MNRKAIIIWGIVGLIAIIGIILTYVLLRNNGSSDTVNTTSQDQNEVVNQLNISQDANVSNEIDTTDVTANQGINNTIPTSLFSKLNIDQKPKTILWYYSSKFKIAFTYEPADIVDQTDVRVGEDIEKIYVYKALQNKDSGQSIEIITIDSDKRFNTIPNIITTQLLTPAQNNNCQIIEKDSKYSIIAKDSKVKDSTTICGKYAKGNNRFFIKPQEEGTATNKLVFVTAGDKELSYDGSNNGKFWYQSVVVE
jgi:hypothetical protein